MNVIGLMSGTSGDGVDAALVSIEGTGHALKVVPCAALTLRYPASFRERLLAAAVGGTVAEICHLNVVLGEWFAKAALRVVKRAGGRLADVHLIGSHGQTVHHLPKPVREPGIGRVHSTLQIAEPAVIAQRTGLTTVADFRLSDLAAGGEGAPLTPYVHYLILRHPGRSRLIVNLGGISNVTFLPASGALDAVRAFDTGPGNMVLDALVRRLTGGRQTMDRDGCMAAGGRVDAELLTTLLAHPFLHRRPPKSTGREEFGEPFLRRIAAIQRRRRRPPNDILATCALFTAMTVGGARRWLPEPVDEVIVGGGGARNRTVMADLAAVFAPAPVRTLDEIGWNSTAFEAIAFAVLAYQTIQGQCANVTAATGARHPVLLGKIVPAGPDWLARLFPLHSRPVGSHP